MKKLKDLVPLNNKIKDEYLEVIEGIKTGGSTNIKDALEEGFNII